MSEGLIGAIIGALAAILGGVIAQLIVYRLDIKREERNELKQIYEVIESILFKLLARRDSLTIEAIRSPYDSIAGKMILYCPGEIIDRWAEIDQIIMQSKDGQINTDTFGIKCKELLDIMRRDLGLIKSQAHFSFRKASNK